MSKLIRMDHTGHSTLAEWTPDDPAAVEAAVRRFAASSTAATWGWSAPDPATPSTSASCRSARRS